MAGPVPDAPAGDLTGAAAIGPPSAVARLRELPTLLTAATPGRLEFATRQAVICALTLMVVQIYQTPEAALTVYVVFFLNRADRATSVVLNLALVVLMSLVILLVLGLAILVIDLPGWRVASIAVTSFGLLFLTSASRLRPVGGIIALVVGYGLDVLGGVPTGEIATRALLYAWLFAGIPAAMSLVVNLVMAPAPHRLVEQALARRLRAAAARLRGAGRDGGDDVDDALAEGPGEIPGWLTLAKLDHARAADHLAALRQAAASTDALLVLIDTATRSPTARWPVALRLRLADRLDEMAAILARGGYPLEADIDPGPDAAALTPAAGAVLAELRSVLNGFAVARPAAEPVEKKAGFLQPDAFSNPEHVQFALRTTAAAMVCYLVYMLLDWPGIHTCFITCYIVALSTAAESVEKLTLRLIGCAIGAAAGVAVMILLVPWMTSIGSLMAVVFLGTLASAWIAAGPPRIAYAGYQIAFAFYLCVIQGPSPAFDMVVARDRIIGILLGNLVSYLMLVHLWPVSVTRRVDPGLSALLDRLRALVAGDDGAARRAAVGDLLARRATVARDIELVSFEPPGLGPPAGWARSRARVLAAGAGLIGPMLVLASARPAAAAAIGDRLGKIAADGEAATLDAASLAAVEDALAAADWAGHGRG